jgi:uncharacterized membrane protein YkvA (DUF1232 family)
MPLFKLRKFLTGWAWLRAEGAVLWRALWHPQTPTKARIAALAVILYVISPIDIIPDFIPILGWLDDLVILPLGLALVRGLIPTDVWLASGGTVPTKRGGRIKDVTPRRKPHFF